MAMGMLKVIICLLIISSTFVDARARRKRRQLSGSSYYISSINPYSNSYSPTAPLTYSSGSFYSGPNYGYPGTGYTGDQAYDTNYYGTGMNQYGLGNPYNYNNQFPFGNGQTYQLQNLGSAYGSGLYGFGMPGFNNRYPNWNQGNSQQYYTGGTGSGISNPGFSWSRKLQNIPSDGRPVDLLDNNLMQPNPMMPTGIFPPNPPLGR